ncbi:talin-2-like [Gigantopelta aegis]|uniref:talin-2-like n=1 Tax=Gigantopelta aegis TaxID=1735272 RepID=UPI001B887502|nr:talin-2-like [Gigantopelta aegis]
MAMLSLKISVVASNIVKTMQFEPSTIVYDACRIIRERVADPNLGNPSEFGLFLADEDPKKGVWLEQGRSLEYYLLRNGDLLEYKKKHRILKVRTLDGALKTLQVDDSHTVGQLMVTICTKMGITNHEEYSLVHELPEQEKEKTLTLKRDKSIAKDQKKLEEMKKKLHTDDDINWLDFGKTLREQGIDQNEILLLRRKFFFSDQNVDARDPIQLNLLYVQSRDAILNGAHPVSQDEAIQFGGIQCQIQFGDHIESKHKPGFLDLKEFLPKEYIKIKGAEKKIFIEHKKHKGLSEVDAKVKYTQMCRSLKTYGITFFLVKEKMKGKNKLVPRLLGITKESVVRVDEKTKEILKTYPLTTVRRWAASPNSFTLDFGDYSDSYYSVQTTEGEQISQLIAGYIDIILRRKQAKDHLGIDGDENSMMFEDTVAPAKATIIQHQTSKGDHHPAPDI